MSAQIAIGPVRESCQSPLCPAQPRSWPALLTARPQRGRALHSPRRHPGRSPKLERLLILDGSETRQRKAVAFVDSRQAYKYALPCGLHLEVLHQQPAAGSTHAQPRAAAATAVPQSPPPILFLHGAMHGAWCWQENFMPYFAERGIETYAVSLRAHGGSDGAESDAYSMADQLDDISSLVSSLPAPPVLVGHSLGGVIAQRYVARQSHGEAGLAPVAGAAFLANPGPRQSMPTHHWFAAQRSLWHSARVFWWMLRRPVHDAGLVREMFFSDDLPEEHFQRYHSRLAAAAQVMPITSADMQAPVTLGPHALPPTLALGGAVDGIVMEYQLRDAAEFFGTRAVVVPGVAHDLMLIKGDVNDASKNVKGAIDSIGDTGSDIASKAGSAADDASKSVKSAAGNAEDVFKDATDSAKDAAKDVEGSLKDAARKSNNAAKDGAEVSDAVDSGRKEVEGNL